MKVYVLQVTTSSDSAYNAYEWEVKGVFSSYSEAELVGEVYTSTRPDEDYFVGEFDLNLGLSFS